MTESEILRLFGSPVNVIESARDRMREWARRLVPIGCSTPLDRLHVETLRCEMIVAADRMDAALKRIKEQ